MSEKTRAELKEQIKIMNHNYQVIREMRERGYQYSVGEIKRLQDELDRTRKALDYCIERFKSLENVLDEKAEASDIPDNPDLYAWAVRIKTIWSELKEITGIDYKKEHK